MTIKSGKSYIRLQIGIVISALLAFGMMYLPFGPINASPDARLKPTPRKAKYSEFPHDRKAHRLDCASCHKFPSDNWNKVRTGEAAFEDVTEYPKHDSCVRCHTQQFFKGARPAVCSICHTNPSPRNGTRHPFPNPREIFDLSAKGKKAQSDFVVGFPHDKHIDIVTAGTRSSPSLINASFRATKYRVAAEESCAVCHQTRMPQGSTEIEYFTPPPTDLGDRFWLKKGTFKTSPTGHATCFTCHSSDSGMIPAPQNCGSCHTLKPVQPLADFDAKLAASMKIDDKMMMDSWRRRDSAGAFRHEFFAHVELSCSACHNVTMMNTADPKTKKVSVSACAACHATPTSDEGGVINFEIDSRKTNPEFQCVKCHITFGKLPIPASHTAVLEAAGK